MSTFYYLLMALPALVIALSFHEMCHAWVADRLGDSTARRMGRITLDPRPHIDPLGTGMLVLSLLLTAGHGPVFGWAKPVQFNPYNLANPRRDGGIIAAAGPLSNLALALVCGLIMHLGLLPTFVQVFLYVSVLINVGLGLFNLIPVAPLDGNKVLKALLPASAAYRLADFEQRHGAMVPLVAMVVFMTVLSEPFALLYQSVVSAIL